MDEQNELQEIDATRPSPKFDAWLAEHFMGWAKALAYEGYVPIDNVQYDLKDTHCWVCKDRLAKWIDQTWEPWSPTTNIAHAWELIDHVLTLVGTPRDNVNGENAVNRFCHAMLTPTLFGFPFVTAERAALLICQAAYRSCFPFEQASQASEKVEL
jgi:hypothetical protein